MLQQQALRGRSSVVASCSYAPVSQRCTRSRRAQPRAQRKSSRTHTVSVRAGPVQINDADLLQFPDRQKWYESKFCADDMPDWNIATFVSAKMVSPELRAVTLRTEISRERVPLRNAYKHVGQRACVRINSGEERRLTVASAPFSELLNKTALYNARGDLFANEVKAEKKVPSSVMADFTVLVSKKEAPEVFGMGELDAVEVGPFVGSGVDLRGSPLMAIYRYPTVVIFASGKGIAAAKALIESSDDVSSSLGVRFRKDVHLYYKAQNEANLCFKEEAGDWEAAGVQVFTTTRGFQDAFDDDEDLTYDPDYTAALILTGGDVEAEKDACEVCSDAEITMILTDAEEQAPVVHLSSVPKNFARWSA